MDGNGFDPCECLWNQNMAVRRLLSLLRQSQTYCTDNECFNELPGSNIAEPSDNYLYFAAFWCFLAMMLYFLRPNTFRNREEDNLKFRHNDSGSSGDSAPPPPLC